MLKYSTYQSIYDKPAPRTRASLTDKFGFLGLGKGLLKVSLLLMLLMLTGTGVVTAFAAASDDHVQKEQTIVVVKSGDTLWEIAASHKPKGQDTRIYIAAIKRLNGLSSGSIQAGDTLVLPI